MQLKKKRFKDTVADLQAKICCLEQRVDALSSTRSSLEFKSRILSSWVECLHLQPCAQLSEDKISNPQFTNLVCQLQQQNQELSSQLKALGETSPRTTAAATIDDPLNETISPVDDGLCLFRELLSSPLPPGAYTITAVEYAKEHRNTAQAAAVHLQQLQNPFAKHLHLSSLQSIKQLLRRHYQLMLALIVCGRYNVLLAAFTFNLESLKPLGPEELDNQASIVSDVLPALNLTDRQEEITAFAMELKEMLMIPVNAELQILQQQLDASIQQDSQEVTLTAGRAADDAGEDGRAAPPKSMHRDLDTSQRLAARLNILYKKQFHIVAVTTSIFLSSLTWLQASKMIVYRWPYGASMQYIARAVAQQWAQKQLRNTQQQCESQQQQTDPC